MPTVYDEGNQEYSNICHTLARKIIYPELFRLSYEQITYEEDTLLGESLRGQILDGEMGIDRIIHCKVDGLAGETIFTIQERFRRPQYAKYQDLTITEWNYATNLPSELSKINAGIFVYGYGNSAYTDELTGFTKLIAVNTVSLIYLLTIGEIAYERQRNRKNQSFLTFQFKELFAKKLIMFDYGK